MSPPLPWYKEGLRFECTGCGKCCTGQPGFVWVSPEEIDLMAQQLNLSPREFKMRYVRNRENRLCLVEKKDAEGGAACVFLKDNKCQIYQSRPVQCRTFPWWKENLSSEASWKLAAESCEGIQMSAPLISYETIEENILNNA